MALLPYLRMTKHFFSATRPNCLHRRKNENEKKSRDILSHFVSYHIVENNLLERLFFRL